MLNLSKEVVEIELVFENLLLEFLSLLLVVLLLEFFGERHNVAHAEDTVSHTGRIEDVESIDFFARGHKFDGLVNSITDTERSTTTCITVELGEDNAVKIEPFVECLGGIYGVLTGHGVNHEKDFSGVGLLLDVGDFVHHLLVNGKTAGGIDDYNIVAVFLSLLDGCLGDFNGVLVAVLSINRHLDLLGKHLELFDSRRTVNVASHEQRLFSLVFLDEIGKLAGERGLTRTLQTCDEDYRGICLEIYLGFGGTHERDEFVVDELYHQLVGLQFALHLGTESLLLYLVGKFLYYIVVDVGVEQCPAHLLQRLHDVDFGEFALAFYHLERLFKLLR